MRVSTSWSQQLTVNNMQNQQAKLNKTQLQLASGLKNLTPADDPVAAAKSLNLQSTIAQSTQYQENIDVATNDNTLEESALASAVDALQKARDLAVKSLNGGALKDTDKQAMGHEVEDLLGHILSLVNTKNASGEYIFSGYKTTTAPYQEDASTTPKTYVYQGDNGQRSVQVAVDRQIATGDPGSAVFEFKDKNGNAQNIFNTLSTFAETLANPNAATDNSVLGKVLNDLDAGIQQITDNRAKTGARLNTLTLQQNQNEQYSVDTQTNLSGIQDLDYAEAISRLNQQQTVLQAAQQSFIKVQKLSLFDYLG